jgi:uncharacterized protein DUF2795
MTSSGTPRDVDPPQRDSSKHSPRLDDELKKEVGSLVHGSPAESRKEEWREQEGAADDEREPSSRTADPQALGPDNQTARTELSRHLRLSAFPGDRDALLAEAETNDAPEPVLQALRRLPEAQGGARRHHRARQRPARPARGRRPMTSEPGLDRHEWTTEFAQLEEDMRDDPFGALPALTELVERMLRERGYELQSELDEDGIVREFADAKEIAAQREQADPGDVAMALQKLVSIYQYVDDERRAP